MKRVQETENKKKPSAGDFLSNLGLTSLITPSMLQEFLAPKYQDGYKQSTSAASSSRRSPNSSVSASRRNKRHPEEETTAHRNKSSTNITRKGTIILPLKEGNIGTPEKKNRRRERKKIFMEKVSNTPSPGSTPHSSPTVSKNRSSLVPSPSKSLHKAVGLNQPRKSNKTDHEQQRAEYQSNVQSPPSTSKKIVEPKLRYDIVPVNRPQSGKVFRKRSKKHKYIHLKSFLGLAKTCIFQTNLSLSTLFKNLSLESRPKKKTRKYFESIDKHVGPERDNKSTQSTPSSTASHSEILISRTETNQSGKIVSESVLIVERNSIPVKSSELKHREQSSSARKQERPKRDRKRKPRSERKRANLSNEVFPETVSEDVAKKGLETGDFIKGFIRVNPKQARDSYVSNEDSALPDYYLTSVADRNGALDGDEVVLWVKPEKEWQEGKRTAVVVYILEKVHPRVAVGNLKCESGKSDFALFVPRDKRMPNMQIPSVYWPSTFKRDPKSFADILFVGKLVSWTEPRYALGVITDTLGQSGDLRIETQAILKEFCLDITPYSGDMLQYLPTTKEISAREFEYREDIRKECIFTIDPLTARDLDDALSVKELTNGHYEIGVHISDASFYLQEGSSLDKMVSSKATTIYLVDSVYHMLPVELCLHCSLLPGEDKLAFSVFWEMDEKGEIYNTRFARTILNSCAQLAYEHAQQMIEDPNKKFKKDELPEIMNGFTPEDLSKTVNVLQKIAVNMREARIQNGSLRIDQTKLLFSLNPHTGEPLDFVAYENKESHRLIEEFMLLANISVARKIEETFPDIAFLRCHEPPKSTMLTEAQRSLESCGIHVDISSSGGIHSSLRKYITDDYQGICRGIVLNHIFAKPMTRARYFCAGTMDSEEKYHHYALSVPIYTHFTSPIRRYADIMVHRLLAASLGYAEKPNWDMEHVVTIAANCNKQKYNAKRAGEASSDLYLAHYIEKHQPYIQNCVVVDVKERSFDAIVLKTGTIVRIYEKKCEDNPSWDVQAIPISNVKKAENEKPALRLLVQYKKTEEHPEPHTLIVEMFTVVKVKLTRVPNSYKLEAFLLRPVPSVTFERKAVV